MLYKVTAKGRAALTDGTFTKKDAKGRKTTSQKGHIVKAISQLEPSATKAAIVKAAKFRSKSAEAKSRNVGFYLVKLKDDGLISAS
jgi:hypothetical protein